MVVSYSGKRYGVVSMDHQVETVPGPKPRRGPPPATGSSYPKHLAGKGQSKATGYNLRLCHWNAKGIRPKKLEIQNVFKSKNIEVCRIQETHLNSNHRFSIIGYETFRRDRESGPKGGLLILVKKTITQQWKSTDRRMQIQRSLESNCCLKEILCRSTTYTLRHQRRPVLIILSLLEKDGS